MTLPRRIAFNEEKSANLQDSVKRAGNGRRTADGRRWTADGGRRTADGGRRTADGG